MGKERPRIPKKALVFGNAALALSAIAAACSGGSEATSPTAVPTTPNTPTPERTASPTVSPTSTPDIKPTPTATTKPTPEATPEPKVLSADELIELVDTALAPFPESADVINAKNGLRLAAAQEALNDPKLALSVVNIFGSAAQSLVPIACSNPDNMPVGQAWLEIRNHVRDYTQRNEANGTFPRGSTESALQILFKVPSNCPHPLLATN